MTKEEISKIWLEVFPNSRIVVKQMILGDIGLSCAGYLSKDLTECSNGISQNDPLTYHFLINSEGDGRYEEYRQHIHIKPNSPYMAYSSVRLRKKNIKNVTPEKLKKRFEQIKGLIVENKDNFINLKFDINDKI